MRILQVVHAYAPEPTGGTERHVSGLTERMRALGHDVVVLAGTMQWRMPLQSSCAAQDGGRVWRIHRADYGYERWHRIYHPDVAAAFAAVLAQERPEVVHVHHWLRLSLDLVQTAAAAGIPAVVSLHDSFVTCPTIHRVLPGGGVCHEPAAPELCRDCLGAEYPGAADLDAEALALRQRVLADELRAANQVLVLSHAQHDRLAPLLPGVDLRVQPFTSFVRLSSSPPPSPPPPLHVASLGNINAAKGQHLLLEAVAGLERRRDVVVHMFGQCHEPAYAARLRQLADGLQVVWHGPYEFAQVQATPLHLVALCSTLPETYGLVLDEAKQLGVPVLASDLGAYPERVRAGGMILPAGDVLALRSALADCLRDPARLSSWRAAVVPPPEPDALVSFLLDAYAAARREGPRPAPRAWFAAMAAHAAHRSDFLERLLGRPV